MIDTCKKLEIESLTIFEWFENGLKITMSKPIVENDKLFSYFSVKTFIALQFAYCRWYGYATTEN